MWKCILLSILICETRQIYAQTVNVSVFYETLCPDSIEFIEEQLFPTYKHIGNSMNIDLIPFGNAKIIHNNGTLEFICQHGPEECYGNEIHSCAIALFSVEESTEFIYCSMASDDPSSNENLEKCANSSGISWASLKMCYDSGQGDKLLERNGIRTRNFQPSIKFVPTVVFNGQFNETLDNEAVTNLANVVCRFLFYKPPVCKRYIYENVEVKLI